MLPNVVSIIGRLISGSTGSILRFSKSSQSLFSMQRATRQFLVVFFIISIQKTLDFHFLSTDAVGFIPVQLSHWQTPPIPNKRPPLSE
jgi:hypothetical protein